jgi:hypothetical protein
MVTPIVSSKYRQLYQLCYVKVFSTNYDINLVLLDYPGRVKSQITSVVCQIQRFDFECILVVSRKVIIWTRSPSRITPLYYIRGRFRYTTVQPRVCTNRRIRGGFDARRPVSTFWYFSKSDSKYGRVHAGTDAVEQARTCAGLSAAMLQEFESWLYSKI